MKKALLILAVLFFAGTVILWAGGGGQASGGGGKTQLTYWSGSTQQGGVEPLTGEFNQANPNIEVTVAYYATDGIKDACKIAASSGTLPDMWNNWGGVLGGFYVENDLTYDLTEYAKANNWDRIYTPAILSLCTLEGKLSGFPVSFSTAGMYYRKDLFSKFNLQEPKTFTEFEQVCATLAANGITPLSTGGLYGWHTMRYLDQLMEYYCGKELHDKILLFEEKFDCEPIVQALTKLKEWSDKKYFPSGFITGDPNGTYINVFAGICAMDIQTQGYTTTIIREQQDINNYGVFPFPNEKGGRMAYWGNMIQLNGKLTSAKLEDCMKYLGFVFSNENTARYASNFTLPLPRQDATLPADRPQLGQLWDFVSRNGGFTITDQAFPTEICDALFRAQDGIINNQITPKDGAGMVQTAIDNYLKNR